MKTIENSFKDWESTTFGYGYGSGEPRIIPALKQFFEFCTDGVYGNAYKAEKLEKELTPVVAWLLINVLCKAGMFEYGSSPRFAGCTERGDTLRLFLTARSNEELLELLCNRDPDHVYCGPDYCNCGPNGYEPGRVCKNPFW